MGYNGEYSSDSPRPEQALYDPKFKNTRAGKDMHKIWNCMKKIFFDSKLKEEKKIEKLEDNHKNNLKLNENN